MTQRLWRLALLCFVLLSSQQLFACELDIKTDKTSYRVGDTIVFKVEIHQQHKPCRKESVDPTIKVSDQELEVVAKTKMKKLSDSQWAISYKAVLKAKTATFSAFRHCPDGGSTKTVTIEAVP